jgi:hypothetical protein
MNYSFNLVEFMMIEFTMFTILHPNALSVCNVVAKLWGMATTSCAIK